jgi:hypothetical protein
MNKMNGLSDFKWFLVNNLINFCEIIFDIKKKMQIPNPKYQINYQTLGIYLKKKAAKR